MSFKVKDLMVSVGPMGYGEDSTCTLVTRTTGAGCANSLYDRAQRAQNELSLLKTQLRRAAARA